MPPREAELSGGVAVTDEEGPVRTQGWSRRLDDDWSPPEQHLNYVPPQGPTQSTREVQRPPLNDQWPSSTPQKSKRGWIWATGAAVLLLLGVVVGILTSGGGSPSKPTAAASAKPQTASAPPSTTNTVNPLPAAASQYEQYFNHVTRRHCRIRTRQFPAANADVAQQTNRIAEDQTTIQNNGSGAGCNPADYSNYLSCVSQEQQTAANAESDETAAVAAAKNDHAQMEAAIQQNETSFSTFITQLDAMTWPTSTTQQDAGGIGSDSDQRARCV